MMTLQTVVIIGLLVSESLGGILHQRQGSFGNYSTTWNSSSTFTSSSSTLTSFSSSSTLSRQLSGPSIVNPSSRPSLAPEAPSDVVSASPLYSSHVITQNPPSFSASLSDYQFATGSGSSPLPHNASATTEKSVLPSSPPKSSSSLQVGIVIALSGSTTTSPTSNQSSTISPEPYLYSSTSVSPSSSYAGTGLPSTTSSNTTDSRISTSYSTWQAPVSEPTPTLTVPSSSNQVSISGSPVSGSVNATANTVGSFSPALSSSAAAPPNSDAVGTASNGFYTVSASSIAQEVPTNTTTQVSASDSTRDSSASLPQTSTNCTSSVPTSSPQTFPGPTPGATLLNNSSEPNSTTVSEGYLPSGVMPPTGGFLSGAVSSLGTAPYSGVFPPSNGAPQSIARPTGAAPVNGITAPSGQKPSGIALPTGTAPYSRPVPFPLPQNASSNTSSCGGATINIPDATLNWWYSTDIDYAAATFSALYNYNDTPTGWTLLEATTTFDVATALATPTYSSYTSFNTYLNSSYVYYYEYTTETPDYASTAVITQTATVALNASTGSGSIPANIMTTPAPASTVLPGSSSDALTALTNTPFVYFSEFAIDSEKPTKVASGLFSCVTSRKIHTLKSAFALYYGEEDPEGQSEVTGDLPEEFLDELKAYNIPLRQLKLGTYTAEPTLLVVVEEVYAAQAVLAAHTESTESALAIPTPAATFVTLTPLAASSQASLMVSTPTTGKFIAPTGVQFIAHTEIAQTSLLIPTVVSINHIQVTVTGTVASPTLIPFSAVIGKSTTTFLAPSNGAGAVTTTIQGSIVVAKADTSTQSVTAIQEQQPQSSSDSTPGLGGLGVVVSAIQAGSGSQSSNGGGSGSGSGSGSSNSGSGSNGGSSGTSGGSQGSSGGAIGGNSGSAANGGSSNNAGSVGSGSGSNNSPPSAQQSQALGNLVSAIEQAGQSAGTGSQATAAAGSGSGSNSGSNSGSGSSGGSQNGDLSSGGSSNGQIGAGGGGGSGNALVPIPVVIGGVTTSIGPSSTVVIGSQTITLGGSAVTISGTPVSLGPKGVVIGTVTHSFATPSSQAGGSPGSPAIITVGDATITEAPVPVVIIGGQSLRSGQTITVNNKAISFGTNGGLVIDGETITTALPASPATLTTAGETIVIGSAPAFVVGEGKTLVAGGPAVTVNGKELSLAPSASALIIDGSFTSILAPGPTNKPLALTIGSEVLTANAATQFLLGSKTILTPGGKATIGGTTVSLDSEGSVAVINGVSQTLLPPIITPGPLLTYGGTVYEANLGSTFDVAGQELTPGGVITADGTTISLASDASIAVINGVTQTLATIQDSAATPNPTSAVQLVFGGKTFTAEAGSTFDIGGSTLTPGGVITLGSGISATTISLDTSGIADIMANGVTITTSLDHVTHTPTTVRPYLTVDGQTFSADASGLYKVAGQTLTPGGSALTFTAQGTVETISLDQAGSVLVVNGVSATLSAAGSFITPGPLTINGQVYGASGGSGNPTYVISGQTLTRGGIITFSDGAGAETVSLSPAGSIAVVNGVTSTIAPAPTITAAPELTIDGQIITALAGSGTTYLLSGKFLTPGGSVVFNGPNGIETVSLSPDGSTLVEAVSGAVTTSALPTAFGIAQTAAPVITIGDETFTALPGAGPSYLLPDGKTLYPGGPALTETIDGSVYIVSLSPSATVLEIEDVGPNGVVTKTEFETLFPATITRSRGTATVTTDVNGASGTQTAGASPTGNNSASLQGAAAIDKKLGVSLLCGALGVALLATLL